MPATTRLRGPMPFKISLPAPIIQPRVLAPCYTTQPVAATPRLVDLHLESIPAARTTQRPVLTRSLPIQPAKPTLPPELTRSKATPPPATTPPTVLQRSLAIRPAATTQPPVLRRSLRTQLAAT